MFTWSIHGSNCSDGGMHTSMYDKMASECAVLSEGEVAVVTPVWSLSSVNSHMFIQITLQSELLATVVTVELPRSRMHQHVALQIVLNTHPITLFKPVQRKASFSFCLKAIHLRLPCVEYLILSILVFINNLFTRYLKLVIIQEVKTLGSPEKEIRNLLINIVKKQSKKRFVSLVINRKLEKFHEHRTEYIFTFCFQINKRFRETMIKLNDNDNFVKNDKLFFLTFKLFEAIK